MSKLKKKTARIARTRVRSPDIIGVKPPKSGTVSKSQTMTLGFMQYSPLRFGSLSPFGQCNIDELAMLIARDVVINAVRHCWSLIELPWWRQQSHARHRRHDQCEDDQDPEDDGGLRRHRSHLISKVVFRGGDSGVTSSRFSGAVPISSAIFSRLFPRSTRFLIC